MTFTVIVEPEAKADLLRLYDFSLQRAEYIEDLEVADRALNTKPTISELSAPTQGDCLPCVKPTAVHRSQPM